MHEGEKKKDETTVIRQYFRGDILLFSQTVQKLEEYRYFLKWSNLGHFVLVAKRVCAAATAHEGDNNTPSGLTGRGVKITSTPPVGWEFDVEISKKFDRKFLSFCVHNKTWRLTESWRD